MSSASSSYKKRFKFDQDPSRFYRVGAEQKQNNVPIFTLLTHEEQVGTRTSSTLSKSTDNTSSTYEIEERVGWEKIKEKEVDNKEDSNNEVKDKNDNDHDDKKDDGMSAKSMENASLTSEIEVSVGLEKVEEKVVDDDDAGKKDDGMSAKRMDNPQLDL